MAGQVENIPITADKSKGIKVGSKVEVFSAFYGWGVVCKHDRGIVVAIEGNYLTLDVLPNGDFAGAEGWKCIIDDVKLVDEPSIIDKEALQYINFFKQKTKLYNDKKQKMLSEISIKEHEIYELYTDLNDMSTLVKSYTAKQSAMSKDNIANLYATMRSGFSSIAYLGSKIIATTTPITMKFEYTDVDDNTRMVSIEMGVYNITIDIFNQDITFGYVSGGYDSDVRARYIHPHILSNGKACWGTWHNAIVEYHRNADYISELITARKFLCEADQQGWYINAFAFAKDNSGRCADCWELQDNCDCDICEYCEHSMDNCTCIRCPSTNDRIDEIGGDYCAECDQYNSEDGTCEY
jgi:hypothetical protein